MVLKCTVTYLKKLFFLKIFTCKERSGIEIGVVTPYGSFKKWSTTVIIGM